MMAQQNVTIDSEMASVDVPLAVYSSLSPQQQYWVDYCAIQGLITNDDGSLTKMTIQECADSLGVDRVTLFRWKKSIPNFEQLANERCAVLFDGARTRKVVNAMYLAATSKLSTQAMSMWMANQKQIEFRMPTQEVKHEVGNSWQALLQPKRQQGDSVIEGEVVDAPATNNA